MNIVRRILDFFVVKFVLLIALSALLPALAVQYPIRRLFGDLLDSMESASPAHARLGGAIALPIVGLAMLAACVLYGRFVEQRTPEELTLPRHGRWITIAVWTGLGIGLISFFALLFLALGWVEFSMGGRLPQPYSIPLAIMVAFLMMAGVAMTEEIIMRLILFRVVEEGLGSWAAVLASAFVFGFSHLGNPGATLQSSLLIALAGIFFAGIYMATRSLWTVFGLHWGWNFALGSLWGMPVSGVYMPGLLRGKMGGPEWLSGGKFGPEAGLVPGVAFAAICICSLIVAHRRGLVFTPRWVQRLMGRKQDRQVAGSWVEFTRAQNAAPSESAAA